MNDNNSTWYIAIILAASAVLAFLLRDFFLQALIRPIAFLVFTGRAFFLSLPQNVLWGMFIFLAVMVGLRNVMRRPGRETSEEKKTDSERGRVYAWFTWINRSHLGAFEDTALSREMGDLVIDTLAFKYQTEPRQIRTALKEGRIQLSPVLTRLVLPTDHLEPEPIWLVLWQRITRRQKKLPEKEINRVIDFLKSELEVARES